MNELLANEQLLTNYILSKAITLHQEGERKKIFGVALDAAMQLQPVGLFPDALISAHLLFSEKIEYHIQHGIKEGQYIMGAIGEDIELFTKNANGDLQTLPGFLLKILDGKDVQITRYVFIEKDGGTELQPWV